MVLYTRSAVTIVVSVLLASTTGCIGNEDVDPTVRFLDVYCDNEGHFNFTLLNTHEESLDTLYHWALNDPEADMPVIEGDGNITLPVSIAQRIMIDLSSNLTEGYDHRFFVMHIWVMWAQDGQMFGVDYRGQKSPYDWDYSTLPPERDDQ